MKRIFSLILSVLLLASAVTSCGKTQDPVTESVETKVSETSAAETTASEITAPETAAAETDAPAYSTDTVTENGIAKAHIVLSDSAVSLEKYAADELVYHIKLVSGADVAITNAVKEDSLPIIIATPDSLPALEELFPEDLSWLRDLGNPAEDVRYGDDGFAIRLSDDGKVYIFGATAKGALNGVYDFIEENMGVLWIRATNVSEYPIIYDEMPTIEGLKVNYREKSPFDVRGWTLSGNSVENQTMYARNKLNTQVGGPNQSLGMQGFVSGHNIKNWIVSSPSYDPNCTEYWGTDVAGRHHTEAEAFAAATLQSIQVNFWSDVTVQCIADSVIAYLDGCYEETGISYIGISLMDSGDIQVIPEMNEPYEYAPGQFIHPSTPEYVSTVYFSFLNKIAKIVGEKYPDVILHAYSYMKTGLAPVCDLEPNVYATCCTLSEDLSTTIDNPNRQKPYLSYQTIMGWFEKTPDVQMYNYYGCAQSAPFYGRPIWYRMQADMQLYAENGLNGVVCEGCGDVNLEWCTSHPINNDRTAPYLTVGNCWNMNAMTYWLYSKLAWNPYEDVDALIEYYCDKVYGDASEYMQEYYRLLTLGMNEGADMMDMEFNVEFVWDTGLEIIWDYFLNVEVDGVVIIDAIKETLHKAYDAADDRAKAHMAYLVDVYDNFEYLAWGYSQ